MKIAMPPYQAQMYLQLPTFASLCRCCLFCNANIPTCPVTMSYVYYCNLHNSIVTSNENSTFLGCMIFENNRRLLFARKTSCALTMLSKNGPPFDMMLDQFPLTTYLKTKPEGRKSNRRSMRESDLMMETATFPLPHLESSGLRSDQ